MLMLARPIDLILLPVIMWKDKIMKDTDKIINFHSMGNVLQMGCQVFKRHMWHGSLLSCSQPSFS